MLESGLTQPRCQACSTWISCHKLKTPRMKLWTGVCKTLTSNVIVPEAYQNDCRCVCELSRPTFDLLCNNLAWWEVTWRTSDYQASLSEPHASGTASLSYLNNNRSTEYEVENLSVHPSMGEGGGEGKSNRNRRERKEMEKSWREIWTKHKTMRNHSRLLSPKLQDKIRNVHVKPGFEDTSEWAWMVKPLSAGCVNTAVVMVNSD